MKLLRLIMVLALACAPAWAADIYGCYTGLAGIGGQIIHVNGIESAETAVVTYPGATVNVYTHGTTTLANIFADAAGTIPITQPWTASSSDASAFWCAPDGFYDVQYSGAGITTTFTTANVHIAFSSGGGGGGGGITTVNTPTGSGLTNSIVGNVLNLAISSVGCGTGNAQIWNGTSWVCGAPNAWSALSSPIANLILPLQTGGTPYTSLFTEGDFGLTPVGTTAGIWTITDNATSATDNSANFFINNGNNSYHQPFTVALTTGGSTFNQLQVCNTGGTSHVGNTVIGNIISCPNLSQTPFSKLWVLDGSNHTGITVYNNRTNQTVPLMKLVTATSGTGFDFWDACANATPNADGSCPTANYVAFLRGDGLLQAVNFVSSTAGSGTVTLNGVTLAGQPTVSGQCPVSTSTSAATWQTCGGGGGGGGGTGAQFQSAYYSATNVLGSFGPGITGQVPVSQGASAAPVYTSAGVPASSVATGTYTVKCDSGTTTLDRLTTVTVTNATPTVTIPDPSDSGCGSNFTFALLAANGVTATVNRETSATFNTFNGAAASTGVTTFNLTAGQYATFNAVDSTHYNVRINNGSSAGSTPWSSIQNPSTTLSLSMTGFTSTFNFTSALASAWAWANVTAATLSTPQSSPVLKLGGQYWTGAATAADNWTFQDVIAAGTNGTSTLTLAQSGSSGAAAVSMPNIILTGSTAHFLPIAQASGVFTFQTPSTAGKCLVSNGTGADPTFQACPAGSTAFPVTVSGGVSGGIPYFSSTTVESASPILNTNVVIKGGGAGNPPTNSAITDNGTTVTSSEGVALSGASGAATTISTTAANANLILAPNGTGAVVHNNGTAAAPSITFAAGAYGLYSASATNIALGLGSANQDSHNFTTAGITRTLSGGLFCFSSSASDATTACDTGMSRSAAGVFAFGTGAAGNTAGVVKAAAYMSVGTKFSSNNGCTESGLTGGATAGIFTLGANSCSIIVTMGNSATAPNGWSCFVNDQTTSVSGGAARETSSTATTATFAFSGTPQINDIINFACTGY